MNSPAATLATQPLTLGSIPTARTVVAVILEWHGKVALFKRSPQLQHDSGLWHCISGYLEPGVTPAQQALEELHEETGVQADDLLELRAGPSLVIDDAGGNQWLVYTFRALTQRRRLQIDWEHDDYRWIAPYKITRFGNRVPWLDAVLSATR